VATKTEETVESILDDIEKRLDALEDVMSFTVRSNQRFKKGQRVQFSAKADRAGVSRTRGRVRMGRVVEVGDGFTMKVLLDGYKKPHSYHHAFFDRVGGRK
jgi:hypothetical protein